MNKKFEVSKEPVRDGIETLPELSDITLEVGDPLRSRQVIVQVSLHSALALLGKGVVDVQLDFDFSDGWHIT